MATLRVVLVEPLEAGNVGAAARAMKNFGFSELWVVGEHPELIPVAGWWASGADDLLEHAHFAATLQEAVADAHLTVATTSLRGRTNATTFTSRSLGTRFAALADDQILALVFGREDSGLTRDELALCQHAAAIPTNSAFPTMNLAQAICVFCYEIANIEPEPVARALPRAEKVERIHERAEALLLEIGFLHENNPSRIYDEIRTLIARADPDDREATIALGVLRQIEWKLRQRE